jgi:8-oxo-dGTP pyrophosphatase MutT (NUDIX family)
LKFQIASEFAFYLINQIYININILKFNFLVDSNIDLLESKIDFLKNKLEYLNCNDSSDDQISNKCSKSHLKIKEDFKLKRCAILIPLFFHNSQFNILLTMRSRHLRSFGGELCFPGGQFDENVDNNFLDTALREANEEIGLTEDNVNIIYQLCPIITGAGYYVVPFIGLICNKSIETLEIINNLKLNPDEVEAIVSMETNYLTDQIETKLVSFQHETSKNLNNLQKDELEELIKDSNSNIVNLKNYKPFYIQLETTEHSSCVKDKNDIPNVIYGYNSCLIILITSLIVENKLLIEKIQTILGSNAADYYQKHKLIMYLYLRNSLEKNKKSSKL